MKFDLDENGFDVGLEPSMGYILPANLLKSDNTYNLLTLLWFLVLYIESSLEVLP